MRVPEMKKNKIQSLVIEHLLKHGQLEILLPDGVKLEIGMTQESTNGTIIKRDDYCWVIASREGRATSLDAYNMGLRFSAEDKTLVLEDDFVDSNGEHVRRVDVV
jgi:hypothetical protein